jgi:NAD(P)-dependent dehydrogenase (short-subunit alcohol dehydrogenase family)
MSLLASYSASKSRLLNVAVIGASGGIGHALSTQLAESDAVGTVYACSRTGLPTHFPDSVRCLPLDLTQERSLQAAADEIAAANTPLDIVIVATGLLHQNKLQPEKSLRQLTAENFMETMAVNALGPILVAQYFLPLMQTSSRSFFGALSARVGSISDNRLGGWHSYRASKAALNMLLKNIAIEYQRKLPRLIVAGLHPGTVDTSLSHPFQKNVSPEKLFTPSYSATQLLTVIDSLNEEDSGYCYAWDGQRIVF